MATHEHFEGTTTFKDLHTKIVHVSGFIMESFRRELLCRLTVFNPRTGERMVQHFHGIKEYITFHTTMCLMREGSEDFVVTEDYASPERAACELCGGRGGDFDGEGNWMECAACHGLGWV